MATKLRIAALGLGWVALHRHLPSIMRHPDLQLIGVIDRHEGLATKVAQRNGLAFAAQTETLEDVSWLDQIDALTIGAPPMSHAPLVLSALRKGKHVLTEKPFAMSVSEGEAMVAAARQANKSLCVVHNFQFSRAACKLRRDLASGRLGKLQRISAVQLGNPKRRLPSWYEQLPLGLFYDESPHFFYLLDSLSGGKLTLERAHGVADPTMKTPKLVHLLYRDQGGVPITVDCQFDSTLSEWFIRLTGEKETVLLDIFRDIYIRLPNDGAHCASDILKTSLYAITQHLTQHVPNGLSLLAGRLDYGNDEIIRRFVSSMITNSPDDKIDGKQALRVLKLQHEAISALQGSLLA